ncbi:MAG: hypothetical protein IJ480_02085 [Clostridia bacterium]|nr:hypothetical protein [Clostridia bacterium]
MYFWKNIQNFFPKAAGIGNCAAGVCAEALAIPVTAANGEMIGAVVEAFSGWSGCGFKLADFVKTEGAFACIYTGYEKSMQTYCGKVLDFLSEECCIKTEIPRLQTEPEDFHMVFTGLIPE